MSSPIQQPRFRKLMSKYFDVQGGGAPGVLLDDIMPVYPVTSDDYPDQLILRDEYLGYAAASGTAVAGQNAFSALCNPPGSGKLVSVKRVRFGSLLAQNVNLGMSDDVQPAVTAQGVARDGRASRRTATPARTSAFAAGGAFAAPPTGVSFLVAYVAAAGNFDLAELDVVLGPGDWVYVYGSTQNQAFAPVSWWFVERAADEGELLLTGP